VTSHVANPNGATPITPGDPQVDNCASVCGGVRGLPVANNILELTVGGAARGGFYAAHPARTLSGKPPFFNAPAAAVVSGTSHANAITATTNANGEAGFILRPRQAGDRYKLRAYIGPPTLPSDGTEATAAMCETGTMVVWRRIRIAKYLQWPYPAGWVAPPAPPATGPTTLVGGMQARIINMQNITLANVAAEYRKAYCEMIIESTAAVHVLTTAEWTAARNYAVSKITAPGIEMSVMLPATNSTPFMFPLASFAQYNAGVAGHPPFIPYTNIAVYWTQVRSLLSQLIDGFVDHFSGNALPFVVMQAPFGDALTYSGTVPGMYNGGYLSTSGQATSSRGCHLWWGSWFYNQFAYGLDANTVHETGHCHYGPHQWTQLTGTTLSGGFPTEHDRHDRCVMGYIAMPGDFCGRCLLRLRGWDIAPIPAN
jgi:hypothetical protein